MTTLLINDFQQISLLSKNKQRWLGMDYGDQWLGLAISNPEKTIATPLETIRRTKFTLDCQRIGAICSDYGVGLMVVGWPINMDGSIGRRCQATRDFIHEMQKTIPIPVWFQDERLSTAAMERTMDLSHVSKKKQKLVIDKMSACYILQITLDRILFQNGLKT